MLLDTLHEDYTRHCMDVDNCEEGGGEGEGEGEGGVRGGGPEPMEKEEGEEGTTNQITENGSHDLVEGEDGRLEGGVGMALPHSSGLSVITETFQGMLRNEVKPHYIISITSNPLHHYDVIDHSRLYATLVSTSPLRRSHLSTSHSPCRMLMSVKSVHALRRFCALPLTCNFCVLEVNWVPLCSEYGSRKVVK